MPRHQRSMRHCRLSIALCWPWPELSELMEQMLHNLGSAWARAKVELSSYTWTSKLPRAVQHEANIESQKKCFKKSMQHLFAHRTNQINVIAKQLGQTKWSVHPKTLLRRIWAGEILQETMCITMCIHAFRCQATSPRLCVVIKWSISTCHPYQTSGVFRISCEDMAQLSDCETFTMKTSTGTWARTSGCHLRRWVPVQAPLLPCDFGYFWSFREHKIRTDSLFNPLFNTSMASLGAIRISCTCAAAADSCNWCMKLRIAVRRMKHFHPREETTSLSTRCP